jgi:hypothetical protein
MDDENTVMVIDWATSAVAPRRVDRAADEHLFAPGRLKL